MGEKAVKATVIHYDILGLVFAGRYREALEEFEDYVEQHCFFPKFELQIRSHVERGRKLIVAIKAQQGHLSSEGLSISRKLALNRSIEEYSEELQDIIKMIKAMEIKNRFQDQRSTVWVLRAVIFAGIVLFLGLFAEELLLFFSSASDILSKLLVKSL